MLLTRVARDRSHWHAILVRDVHGADSERREASGAINHRRREKAWHGGGFCDTAKRHRSLFKSTEPTSTALDLIQYTKKGATSLHLMDKEEASRNVACVSGGSSLAKTISSADLTEACSLASLTVEHS